MPSTAIDAGAGGLVAAKRGKNEYFHCLRLTKIYFQPSCTLRIPFRSQPAISSLRRLPHPLHPRRLPRPPRRSPSSSSSSSSSSDSGFNSSGLVRRRLGSLHTPRRSANRPRRALPRPRRSPHRHSGQFTIEVSLTHCPPIGRAQNYFYHEEAGYKTLKRAYTGCASPAARSSRRAKPSPAFFPGPRRRKSCTPSGATPASCTMDRSARARLWPPAPAIRRAGERLLFPAWARLSVHTMNFTSTVSAWRMEIPVCSQRNSTSQVRPNGSGPAVKRRGSQASVPG